MTRLASHANRASLRAAEAAMSTELVDRLVLSDADRERFAAVGRSYNCPAWWDAFDDVPIGEITGGEVSLRYVVVREGGAVAAIQPLLHLRGAEQVFAYNLRRHYFAHFFERSGDIPIDARTRRLFNLARGYGKVLRGIGCPMDELLVATSPLSYGDGLAMADDDPARRTRCRTVVAEVLQAEARRLRCPVLLPFLPPDLAELHAAGFREVFQFYDNRIPLDAYETFDDYLATFSKSSRQNKRREMRRTAEAGIVFETIDDPAPIADRVRELYEGTCSRHADNFPRFPARYWVDLKRSFGERLRFLLAKRGGEVVGFHTLLECPVTGDLCSHRTGREYGDGLDEVPFYFEMCFYEPIRRALAGGFRGLRLGPGADQGKARRGAQQIPQHGYVWFPRAIDRFLMGRYMLRFGRMLEGVIAKTSDVPLDVIEYV